MDKLCKIRDIQRAVAQFETGFAGTYGICLNEGMLLCSLSKTKLLSSGEMADLLGLTASNMSKVIRSVEDKGLVERVMGTEDKRQMYFSLSVKGRNLIENVKCGDMEIPELLVAIL